MRNLEVYFSKLPKSCLECPCFQNDEMCCGLDDGTQDFFKDEIDGGKCPLKEIHSHNSLCEKIDKWQKLKEFLNEDKLFDLFKEEFVDGYKNCLLSIKTKMQELEAKDV